MNSIELRRRHFLSFVVGSAAVACFPIARAGCRDQETGAEATEILYWVTINSDNSVTCTIPQTEIGQGVSTTISQLLAEELDIDWNQVGAEFYDPNVNIDNNNMYVWTATLGSMSAHYLFDPARIAGSQIRHMLIEVAAKRLAVRPGSLSTNKGYVSHDPSGKKMSYAELACDAAKLSPPDPGTVSLKTAAEWQLIGKPLERIDARTSAHGSTLFGIDVVVPGMRYASIRQCPVLGGSLLSVDESALSTLSGSPKVVKLEGAHVGYNSPVPEGEDPELWATPVMTSDAVAVVADTWWQAKRALDALRIEWDYGDKRGISSAGLESALRKKLDGDMPVVGQRGDVESALADASLVHSSEYVYPYMDPAPLEPLNCTALVDAERAEVWAGSQYADDALRVVSKVSGLPRHKVTFNLVQAGGGFGRRGENDFVHQAVQLAKALPGTPIKLIWTREECVRKSFYAPLTIARYRGAVDSSGRITAWACNAASTQGGDQAYGSTEFPFHFPNSAIAYDRNTSTAAPFGWMRGVGYTQHMWMNFGFLDELCQLAKRDPATVYAELMDEYVIPADTPNRDIAVARSKSLGRVLETTLDAVRWHDTETAENFGRGLAVGDSEYYAGYGSSSAKAAVVHVSLEAEGVVTIENVYIAIDCGTVINPDIVRSQLEGGVAYALTNAFFSEITLTNGKVDQSNFHDYPILKLGAMPKVTVDIVESSGTPLSVGEDSVPITIAALVNAIADAGGGRIRRLPIGLEPRARFKGSD